MSKRKLSRSQFLGTSLGLSVFSVPAVHSLGSFGFSRSPTSPDPGRPADSAEAAQSPAPAKDRIRQDREVALKILKPTKKELEHGFELHKNSLVFDTYGFMPRASVDGEAIANAIEQNASPLELQDMREDMMMSRFVDVEREREELENAWKAAGVNCLYQNAGEEGNAIQRLLKRLARFTYTTDMLKDVVGKAGLQNLTAVSAQTGRQVWLHEMPTV